MCAQICVIRNCLMWLQRTRSPKTCSQQARAPGEPMVHVPDQKPAGSTRKESQCCSLSPEAGRDQHPSSFSQGRGLPPYLALFFYSDLQLIGWGPPTTGKVVLFHLPIQMLVSYRNSPTDTPRITLGQMSGHSTAPSNGHIKLTTTEGKPELTIEKRTIILQLQYFHLNSGRRILAVLNEELSFSRMRLPLPRTHHTTADAVHVTASSASLWLL